MLSLYPNSFLFFFNDTATTEIYTLSLHDALPISIKLVTSKSLPSVTTVIVPLFPVVNTWQPKVLRSEEHTSELQSQSNLVCRLLLEKKKNKPIQEMSSETGSNSVLV